MRFCPTCGHTLTDAENFCPQCGSAVAAPPPPPPPPPMYTAPVSPLMRDLKACIIGLSVSAVYLVLVIVSFFINEYNEWMTLATTLLFGGVVASAVFASTHCQKACAWITAAPWIGAQLITLISVCFTNSSSYLKEHFVEYLIVNLLSMAIPAFLVFIVGMWRKRRPPEMVRSMAMLLAFGLLGAVQVLSTLLVDLFPVIGEGAFEWYYLHYLSTSFNALEIAGFAAVYAISWYMLKRCKPRFR